MEENKQQQQRHTHAPSASSNRQRRKLAKAAEGEIDLGKASENEDGLRHQTVMMTRERLMDIASKPNTTVYEWDTSECKAVPMSEVRPRLVIARQAFHAIKAERPELTDDGIRKEIADRHPQVKDIFLTHGRLFEWLTSSETDSDKADTVWYMVYLREAIENGEIDETAGEMKIAQTLQSLYVPGLRTEAEVEQAKDEVRRAGGHHRSTVESGQPRTAREKPETGAQRRARKRAAVIQEGSAATP